MAATAINVQLPCGVTAFGWYLHGSTHRPPFGSTYEATKQRAAFTPKTATGPPIVALSADPRSSLGIHNGHGISGPQWMSLYLWHSPGRAQTTQSCTHIAGGVQPRKDTEAHEKHRSIGNRMRHTGARAHTYEHLKGCQTLNKNPRKTARSHQRGARLQHVTRRSVDHLRRLCVLGRGGGDTPPQRGTDREAISAGLHRAITVF